MRVTVIFDFPEIESPDSEIADEVVEYLTAQTVDWREEWKFRGQRADISVWEVEGVSP